MKKVERKVKECLKRFGLIRNGESKIILAVSGGPDSMSMLRVFEKISLQKGIRFGVAHYDHRLRPCSTKDAEFVEEYCSKRNIPFHLGRRTMEKKQKGESPEEFARKLRYAFLQKVAKENGYHLIATAHTADDQIETVLLRIIRGTGIEGLRGILPRSGIIIRPFLLVWRDEVMKYIKSEKLSFIIDPTNIDNRVPRNLLRNEVIPLLLKYYPGLKESILKLWLSALFLDSYNIALKRLAEDIMKKGEARIPIKGDEADVIILRYILSTIYKNAPSSRLTSLVEEVVFKPGYRSITLRKGWIMERVGSEVVVRENIPQCPEGKEFTINGEGEFHFMGYRINIKRFKREEIKIQSDPFQAFMDAEKVSFPITVRTWRSGDKFVPLGMKNRKKLQDLFTDLKIPKPTRAKYPLFISHGEIIWVGGIRISEKAKVDKSTKAILVIKLSEAKQEK